jgi:hypothetical protein
MVFRADRLYTTDPSDFIRVYDSLSGTPLESLAGPSLLMSAGQIAISPRDEIVVMNQKSGQITLDRFDFAGNLLGTLATGRSNWRVRRNLGSSGEGPEAAPALTPRRSVKWR